MKTLLIMAGCLILAFVIMSLAWILIVKIAEQFSDHKPNSRHKLWSFYVIRNDKIAGCMHILVPKGADVSNLGNEVHDWAKSLPGSKSSDKVIVDMSEVDINNSAGAELDSAARVSAMHC